MSQQNNNIYQGKPCIKCGSTLRYKKERRCVQCMRTKCERWRRTNSDYDMARKKEWKQNNRESANDSVSIWRDANPEKIEAHKAVFEATESGIIPKANELQCADQGVYCRGQAAHYHHESYDEEHWLDVIPLCSSCHQRRHNI